MVVLDDERLQRCRAIWVTGAGSKAGTYLGVLEALERYDSAQGAGDGTLAWTAWLEQSCGSFGGASAGATMALALALGLRAAEMRQVLHPLLEDVQRIVPQPDVANLAERYGLDDGRALRQIVSDIMRRGGLSEDTTFVRMHSLTRREFACSGTNLNTRQARLFNRHSTPTMRVLDAVTLSMGIPFVFAPIEFAGDLYIDGALTCNYPPQDAFDPTSTMLWTLDSPRRTQIDGWVSYMSAVVNVGLAAQEATERRWAATAPLHMNVRLPASLRDAQGFDMNQTTDATRRFVACGYAAVVERLVPMLRSLVEVLLELTIHWQREVQLAGLPPLP